MALCRWRWPVRPTPPAWSSTIPRPDRCTAISCVEPGQKYTQRDRLVTISSIISFDFFRLTPEINRLRTTSPLPMWAMRYGASHIAPYPKYCFSVHSNRCYPRRRTANTLIPASVIITATDSTTVPSEPVLARRPVADCGLLCDASPELGLSVSPVPGCCVCDCGVERCRPGDNVSSGIQLAGQASDRRVSGRDQRCPHIGIGCAVS